MNDFSARRRLSVLLLVAQRGPSTRPRHRSPALRLWPLVAILASSSAAADQMSVARVDPQAATSAEHVELVTGALGTAEGDEDEDEGLLDKVNSLYPIYLDDDLEPEVEEKVIPLWLTSACCGQMCGALWIPMLIVGEDPGVEYFVKEALIAIVVETLTNLVGGAATTVGGIGTVLITANLLYLTPVSIINTYDRALKRERAKDAESAAHLPSVSRRSSLAMAY